MHIPDGYLSPRTCIAFYAAMAPVWYIASMRAQEAFKTRRLPMLAMAAAFTFLLQMLNMPLPGGSSGHMTGAVIAAIALGPWAAVMALTVALALQAILFGDGGLTTLAANAFNMGFVSALSGYYLYRIISGKGGSARKAAAAFIAAYAAVTLSATATALELGIQPHLASAGGRPLYFPYDLSISIPAMLFPHLLFIGPVEGTGTALVVTCLLKSGVIEENKGPSRGRLWAALALVAAAAPLGLLASGTPWGEWESDWLKERLGFLPEGIERLSGLWKGVIPDYAIPGIGEGAFSYLASALAGSVIVVSIVYLWGRFSRR